MESKILIVEDTATIRDYQKLVLRRAGYEVCTAVDGVDGLNRARQVQPDLILMDIQMPRLDGVACCQRLKADDRTKDILIVMVTTQDQKDCVREAFAVGCNGYLTKPIDSEELLHKIESLLRLARARRQLQDVL